MNRAGLTAPARRAGVDGHDACTVETLQMIEVRDLHKSYGDFEALRGVSFNVERGEIIGLLGPNGAGKSTAMRIITGYLAPTSGSVRVNGREVIEDPLAAQRHIGYLPEGNPLYLDLRLLEALRFAAEMHGLRGSERDRAVRDAIAAAGLDGKERQRIVDVLSWLPSARGSCQGAPSRTADPHPG